MQDGGDIARARSGRHLKTAAEALTALRILGTRPEGITSDGLAASLGKSTATARYLLNTLCQEGYAERDGRAGTYRLTDAPPWGEAWGDGPEGDDASTPVGPGPAAPTDTVTELSRHTRQRDRPGPAPHRPPRPPDARQAGDSRPRGRPRDHAPDEEEVSTARHPGPLDTTTTTGPSPSARRPA